MSFLDWFKPKPLNARAPKPQFKRGVSQSFRRFDAAQTTEQNKARWCGADHRSINQLLFTELRILHQRCAFEARNSPIVDGTIETHARDVIGPTGPDIQVDSVNDGWSAMAEAVIKDWAETAGADGSTDLGEWLRADIRDMWLTGDMLTQIVTDPLGSNGIKTRVHPLDPRGLSYLSTSANSFLGIERNEFRRPIRYHVSSAENLGWGAYNVEVIEAKHILHTFQRKERTQIRGYPLMTTCLDPISQLRQYDGSVISAATMAAMLSVLVQNKSEIASTEAIENPEPFEINDGGMTTVPWGWEANPLNSNQPLPQNTLFRTDRVRELGYPVAMPLIHLRHDASDSNYSSARFDCLQYDLANDVWRAWLFRTRVKPIILMVLQEAMLIGRLPPLDLRRIKLFPIWQNQTAIDPLKEILAAKVRLEMKVSSPIAEARLLGNDFARIVKEWQKANKILTDAGLPPMLGGVPSSPEEMMAWLQLDKTLEPADKTKKKASEATAV